MADSAYSGAPRDPLKEDMHLLLECITCKPPCTSSQKQALTLMADMYLMEDDNAREIFRTEGFLEAVIDLLKNTASLEVKQACLCTLACATDNNVNTQIRLCKSDVFTLLYSLLRSSEATLRLRSGTVVLLANIMNNNSQGQKMARETKLLYKLIDMFKSLIQEKDDLIADPILINYFQNIGNGLSVACDNPQNELNQCQCISIFPVAVHVLGLAAEGCCDLEGELVVLKSVINVFTSCIANNGNTQDKLYKVGGLRVMTRMLIKQKEKTITGGEDEKRQERLEFISCLMQAILAAVTNNDTNTKFLVSFKMVSLLLELLSDKGGLNPRQQLIAITCLETLIENSDDHCNCFIECNGESLLINLMAESVDESIDKMIPIVIKMSRNRLKVPQVIEEDEEEEGIFEAIDMPNSGIFHGTGHLDAAHGCMVNESAAAKNEGLLKKMSVIPFNTRINEWLEKAETQLQKPPLYSPSLGPADTTNKDNAPLINTTLPAPPSVCTSFNASTVKSRLTDLEMSLAEEKERRRCLEIELEEIKRREVSNHEMRGEEEEETTFKKPSFKPKRFKTRGEKNSMTRYKHKATPRPLTREGVQETKRKMYQSSKSIQLPNLGLVPYTSTPSERIIPHTTFPKRYSEQYHLSSHHQPIASPLTHSQPLVAPSTPKRQRPPSRIKLYKQHQIDQEHKKESHQPSSSLQHQESRNEITNIEISDDSHLTGCIGCMSSPAHTGDSLNSRNFIPSLSLSNSTCRYHRKITETVLTKKELHVVPEGPKEAVLPLEPFMTSKASNMEKDDVIFIENDNVVFSPLPSSPSQYNIIDSPISTITTSTQCTTSTVTMSNKENEAEPGMKSNRKNNRGLPLMTLSESTNGACRPLDEFIAKQVKGKATKEMARKVAYDVSIPHHNRNKKKSTKGRQKSLFFTDEEVSYLRKGVARLGPRWKHILNAYPFQEGRTSTSLKDNYYKLMSYIFYITSILPARYNITHALVRAALVVIKMRLLHCQDNHLLLKIKFGLSYCYEHYDELRMKTNAGAFKNFLAANDYTPVIVETDQHFQGIMEMFNYKDLQIHHEPFPKKLPFSSMLSTMPPCN
uniref:Myb-like domain-containing protein n=1 Tax=Amphimedon queenslandica TaxID=400682 RepID=A0A1X7VA86_AMPQE